MLTYLHSHSVCHESVPSKRQKIVTEQVVDVIVRVADGLIVYAAAVIVQDAVNQWIAPIWKYHWSITE